MCSPKWSWWVRIASEGFYLSVVCSISKAWCAHTEKWARVEKMCSFRKPPSRVSSYLHEQPRPLLSRQSPIIFLFPQFPIYPPPISISKQVYHIKPARVSIFKEGPALRSTRFPARIRVSIGPVSNFFLVREEVQKGLDLAERGSNSIEICIANSLSDDF